MVAYAHKRVSASKLRHVHRCFLSLFTAVEQRFPLHSTAFYLQKRRNSPKDAKTTCSTKKDGSALTRGSVCWHIAAGTLEDLRWDSDFHCAR
ncbi:hypothetical protein SCHPADRAFT_911777 [Schizopora paradoxa]|uniref:Uncharacterized protein n=1 Tax=Schizopora paradoxa TaxID=27342 RepID=A0A0H2QXU9_9AGAM|nr:hypothetical protein SCHPADRAFT_911777 [Schizopora paradoxa]